MTGLGEVLSRVISCSWYIVFSIGTFVALFFTDIERLFWISLLCAIFLLDRFIRIKKGDRSISEIYQNKNINVAESFTPNAYSILTQSFRRSLNTGEDPYLVLVDELLKIRSIRKMLSRLDVSEDEFSLKLTAKLGDESDKVSKDELIKIFESIGVSAYKNAETVYESYVEPRNLFAAVALSGHPPLSRLLGLFNINPNDIAEVIIFNRYARGFGRLSRIPAFLGGLVFRGSPVRKRAVNRAWTSRPTKFLDNFSRDFTDMARSEKVGFLIGHEREYEALMRAVSMPGKPNAILVGEPGAGVMSIVAHLAYNMTKDNVPNTLFDKRLVSLDVSKLMSGAAPEEAGDRIRKIVEEIAIAGNVVLFVNNIHDLFRTSEGKAMNAIDSFLPLVQNENIPVIAATYPREFKTLIEPRTDFISQFDVVNVDEISEQEAVRFLSFRSILLEREFRTTITFGAIRKSVELAHKYFHTKTLPGSASDLLKEAVVYADQFKIRNVTPDIVIKIAEMQSKIPIKQASGGEAEQLLNLENLIHKKLVNQSNAVSAVSRALREYRSGLSRKGGPIASFLFVGPTGVGKTELSKILAELQFGSRDLMQRFDMSEYQDRQSIARLIGNPDGSKTGALTDAIFAHPYSLILLDEFEKAHQDILNIFLQVFDDGRLTDSLGRTANFENTIVIATSNAHSDLIKKRIEEGADMVDINIEIKQKLTDYFKPELLNRFSEIVAFRNLNPDEIKTISGFMVKEVSDTIMESHGINLKIDDEALTAIASLGYSPVFGARPLRQVISEKVRSVLAEKLLRKEIGRGNELLLSYKNGEFIFSVLA